MPDTHTPEDATAGLLDAIERLNEARDRLQTERDALALGLADVEKDRKHLAQRLADAERERDELRDGFVALMDRHANLLARAEKAEARATRAEDMLRHIATWQPDGLSDAELVTLFRDQAGATLTPTEEPRTLPRAKPHIVFYREPTEEPEHGT